MIRRLIIIIMLCLLPKFLFAQASILLTPVDASLVGKPGESIAKDFTIVNTGKSSFLLVCNFGDLWYKNEKTITAEAGTFKDRQASSWLKCSPNRVLVAANGKQVVKVVASIPKDLEGDAFSMLYTEMRSPEELKDEGNMQMQLSGRIGARIIATADGTQKPSAEIVDVTIGKS
ncbi:MAG: hypothetical protein JNK65_01990, partial [Deltaproteobacteria bacterium]|nr:hypothetical protein [Deltaproteobacteria bacterium]